MSELLKPEVIKAEYEDFLFYTQVTPDGYWRNDRLKLGTTLEETLEQRKISDLAWVAFYKEAVITIRHPEALLPDEEINHWTPREESTRTSNIKFAPERFVTDLKDGLYVFQTRDEILESGTLTTHMQTWLVNLAMKGRYSPSVMVPFLSLLPGSPTSMYEVERLET